MAHRQDRRWPSRSHCWRASALKPRKAFGPIRVAATGASVSPPLFESLELLGRDRSLHRLRAGRDRAAAAATEA